MECPVLGVPAGTCAFKGGKLRRRSVGVGAGALRLRPFGSAASHRCVEIFDAAQVRVRYALDVTVAIDDDDDDDDDRVGVHGVGF